MSTKEESNSIKDRAVEEVINKLRFQQSKLRMDVDRRGFNIKQLTEKQTQEKREIAELGRLIKNLEKHQKHKQSGEIKC